MVSITEQQAKDFIHNSKNPNEAYGCWAFNTVNEPLKEDMFGALARAGEVSLCKRVDTFYVYNIPQFLAAVAEHQHDNERAEKLFIDTNAYNGSPAKALYFTYDTIEDMWEEIEDTIEDLKYKLNLYQEELDYIRRIM